MEGGYNMIDTQPLVVGREQKLFLFRFPKDVSLFKCIFQLFIMITHFIAYAKFSSILKILMERLLIYQIIEQNQQILIVVAKENTLFEEIPLLFTPIFVQLWKIH